MTDNKQRPPTVPRRIRRYCKSEDVSTYMFCPKVHGIDEYGTVLCDGCYITDIDETNESQNPPYTPDENGV
jgi:hypothetical protein